MEFDWEYQTLETIFSVTSLLATIGWGILIFLPRGWPTVNAIPALVIPGLIAAAYTVLIATSFGEGGGGFGSLADVRQLFSSDAALLAGWLHYLAFDLLVGIIIARQADETGINRVIQVPFLLLAFLFGPAGFLLFQLVRGALTAARQN